MSEAAPEITPIRPLAIADTWRYPAMTDPHSTPPLCACGCGQPTRLKKGKFCTWVGYHYLPELHRHIGRDHGFNWKGGVLLVRSKHTRNIYVMVAQPEHPNANPQGYVKWSRLVAEAKLGRYLSAGEVVHHIDRNTWNDSPENLMVLTSGEHTLLHLSEDSATRRVSKGEHRPMAKLTESDVRQIRGDLRNWTNIALARKFGVSSSNISSVARGETWAHIEGSDKNRRSRRFPNSEPRTI